MGGCLIATDKQRTKGAYVSRSEKLRRSAGKKVFIGEITMQILKKSSSADVLVPTILLVLVGSVDGGRVYSGETAWAPGSSIRTAFVLEVLDDYGCTKVCYAVTRNTHN